MMLAASRIANPYHLDYVVKVVKHSEADVVLLCGDVGINEKFMRELSSLSLSILMVSGDDDDIYVIKLARKYNVLIDGGTTEVAGVRVGGVGAINTSLDISSLTSRVERIDVLLTHLPPHGCLDRQPPLYIPTGLRSLRMLLEVVKPSLVFVGHSARPGLDYCGGALVIGVAGFLVLVDSPKPRWVRFIPLDRAPSSGPASEPRSD